MECSLKFAPCNVNHNYCVYCPECVIPPFFSTREKVFRLKPVLDEHVTVIKDLAKSIEVPICFHTHSHTHPHLNSTILAHCRAFTGVTVVGMDKLHSANLLSVSPAIQLYRSIRLFLRHFHTLYSFMNKNFFSARQTRVLYLDFISEYLNLLKCLSLAPSAGRLLEAREP